MSFVKDAVSSAFGGSDAKKASERGAKLQADAQREALEYLKEREALPQQFREGALTQLGGLYGLEGGEGSQQQLIDQAQASPLYNAITGTREAGEKAILRNASATGGLRSGNSNNALYDFNQRLDERALTSAYDQQLMGLQGMAGLESNANNIANLTAGIGQTQAQGLVGGAQGVQDALGMGLNLAGTAAGAGAFDGLGGFLKKSFSDQRLKTNVVKIGSRNGLPFYNWDWNDIAKTLGLSGSDSGHMAHEVERLRPEAVGERSGYKTVNYALLEAS